MLVSPCADERQESPGRGIVRCNGHRALDQRNGFAVLDWRSGPHCDPGFLDEPRRFRVGRRPGEPPPGQPTCRQRGRAARQQPPPRHPSRFRCRRLNYRRRHVKRFRSLRHLKRNVGFLAQWLEPIADARDGLDDECTARCGRCLAQPADHPMHGIVAHHHAGPAAFQEFVAAEDGSVGVDEGKQDLHYATFERHRRGGAGQQETRREDPGAAEIEVGALGKRELRPVDGSRRLAPDQTHRRYIGQGSTLHHSRQWARPAVSVRRERDLHGL